MRVRSPREGSTLTTSPMGTPGTKGLLPRDPKVSSRSPGLIFALPLSIWTERARSPWPVAKPSSPVFSRRVPTVKSGSLARTTVAVSGPTVATRPTSPSPLRTVMSRSMPSLLPASMVTVQEKPWAAPMAMTSAPLMPYWPAPARLSISSSSWIRLRVWSSLPSLAFRAAFSRVSVAMRLWRSPESRTAPMALATGSTAVATPSSTGPKTAAAACRAPSTGESSPVLMSTVISANAMAIRRTRSSRLSRVSLTCGGRAFLVDTRAAKPLRWTVEP